VVKKALDLASANGLPSQRLRDGSENDKVTAIDCATASRAGHRRYLGQPVNAPAVPDYHVHSRFSDGDDDLCACVRRAAQLGLPEIGFSDHLTPARFADVGCGPDQGRLTAYVEAVRATAAVQPELRELAGIEADYLPEAADETLALLAAYPFDYVLCSVHFVDGFCFEESDDPKADGWRDVDRVWQRYYETLIEAAQTGAFDVAAHLDLPKK
jgi:histidinol-phosphatase (PHP family)